MTRINSVHPGDIIGIAAPSARFNPDLFNQGIEKIKAMGFKVKVPESIFEKKRYLAGEDHLRASSLQSLFCDPQVKAVLSVRGGFGAMRILDMMDWEKIAKHPKPMIGFSDITAFLTTLFFRTGMTSIHGPTLLSLAKAGDLTVRSFLDCLAGEQAVVGGSCARTLVSGSCKGILLGGNLSTLCHLCGTPFQPRLSGVVLFIEDIAEPAYKIDRMLFQMKSAGVFEGLSGVVTGTFTDCENDQYIDEIILENFEDRHIPIMAGLEAGHGPVNLSLLMGVPVFFDTDSCRIEWHPK